MPCMPLFFSSLDKLYKKALHHRYGLSLGIYLTAAVLTGLACVLFMRIFEFVYAHQLHPGISHWTWILAPLLFLLAIELIRLIAPCADGAGIPQTIFAAKHLDDSNYKKIHPLVSFRTMFIKIIALLIGLWGGASTGREGPTVHIAACLFFGITWTLHRVFRLPFNMRSAVVAGGAAGLAAAFNTPLAGVTFAIEELSSDYFSNIKDMVLMAIIVAGISAKSLTGEYTYFGQLSTPATASLSITFLIGILCGAGGAFFAFLLVKGRKWMITLKGWKKYSGIFILVWAVISIAYF